MQVGLYLLEHFLNISGLIKGGYQGLGPILSLRGKPSDTIGVIHLLQIDYSGGASLSLGCRSHELTLLLLFFPHQYQALMEEGAVSSRRAQLDVSKTAGTTLEGQPLAVPEPECSVRPPDARDREATELDLWPLERAPSRPEPDAGFYAHLGHWAYGFSMNARVPPQASRDHLANERTFLAWVRTSISLAIVGTVIAQLFRLQHSLAPQPFGFYRLGVPLASVCHVAALLMVLVGAQRFRMQQNAMINGRITAGGWEPWIVGVMVLAVSHTIAEMQQTS